MSIYLNDLPTPERVMIILAHPDDAEFFAGGTLAKWARAGVELTLCLVTSGNRGSGDLALLDDREVARMREAETLAAAQCLGIKNVIFLRHPDGELIPSVALRRDLVRMIRLKRPDTIVSSDSLLRWRGDTRINHPDHWAVAEAVMSAVYPAARDHLNFPEIFADEGLAPHKVRWLYMSLPLDPNYRVETTDFLQDKIGALKQHRSQVGDPDEFEQRMRERFDPELTTDGPPRYAEYFRVLRLD